MAAGWLRRVVYSFLGMLSGFAVLLILMFAVAMLENAPMPNSVDYPHGIFSYLLQLALIYSIIALLGWIIVGPIFAVTVPARVVARMHPLISFLLGVILGNGSILILFTFWFMAESQPFRLAGSELYWILSAVVAGPAFVVYAQLLRRFEMRGGLIWRDRAA
jgi:hypothetical protein